MAMDVHAARRGIQAQPACRHGPPAQDRLDARDEFAWAEGFADIVVGAERQTEQAIDLGDAGGDDDDRHIRKAAHRLAERGAIEAGQLDVEHHQIRHRPANLGQGARAIVDDLCLVARSDDEVRDQAGQIALVFNNQNPRRHAPASPGKVNVARSPPKGEALKRS